MQWNMTEEHGIYSDEKAHRIDAMCDLFDVFFDVPVRTGSQYQEGYMVDVFELPDAEENIDYAHFLKDSMLAYLDIYREYNFEVYKELLDRRSKDKLSLVSMGKMEIEELLRNMIPADKYIPRSDGPENNKISHKAQVEKYLKDYELGLKTVINELRKNSDTNVECFNVKCEELMSDYDGLITGTYFGIVFDMKAFICGKYFFVVVYGSNE